METLTLHSVANYVRLLKRHQEHVKIYEGPYIL
jgi:hypothetical protein